jgi:hypothetical protein
MISVEDCIALCGLSREEVAAIGEHERVPETAAAALANELLTREGGEATIRDMIVDDIRQALDDNRRDHAARLFAALRHYLSTHPAARDSSEASSMGRNGTSVS